MQPGVSLHEAEQTMIYQGVRMLFVVSGMPSFLGLVTTTDLHGDRQMALVHERGDERRQHKRRETRLQRTRA